MKIANNSEWQLLHVTGSQNHLAGMGELHETAEIVFQAFKLTFQFGSDSKGCTQYRWSVDFVQGYLSY